jgi:hypothetical protein
MVREPHHERLVPCPFTLSLSKGSSNLDANQLLQFTRNYSSGQFRRAAVHDAVEIDGGDGAVL